MFTLSPVLSRSILTGERARGERLSPKEICALSAVSNSENTHGIDTTGTVVKPLRWVELPKAVETSVAAFEHDPLTSYMRDTPDYKPSPFNRRMEYAHTLGLLTICMAQPNREFFTVDHGAAYGVLTRPPAVGGHPIDKVFDKILEYFELAWGHATKTPQQKQRQVLIKAKVKAVYDKLEPRLAEMNCLDGLATHPDHQGKGYGGAIVDTITAFADSQDRATFLFSSNEINTFFYESHGFETADEIILGDDDPTWDKKPFVIKIMIREPKASGEKNIV